MGFNKIHSLKYLRVSILGCKDIRIRKFDYVAKTFENLSLTPFFCSFKKNKKCAVFSLFNLVDLQYF